VPGSLEGKVALVTGASRGAGRGTAVGLGEAGATVAADPDVHRRNGGSFSSGGLAREYGFTDLDGSQPDCWRYLVEVQDAGKPADVTGYR
jgi:NAD(P)-dependent dehydrogenase (short-subunit alcohol dehydrogenase family)